MLSTDSVFMFLLLFMAFAGGVCVGVLFAWDAGYQKGLGERVEKRRLKVVPEPSWRRPGTRGRG